MADFLRDLISKWVFSNLRPPLYIHTHTHTTDHYLIQLNSEIWWTCFSLNEKVKVGNLILISFSVNTKHNIQAPGALIIRALSEDGISGRRWEESQRLIWQVFHLYVTWTNHLVSLGFNITLRCIISIGFFKIMAILYWCCVTVYISQLCNHKWSYLSLLKGCVLRGGPGGGEVHGKDVRCEVHP